MGLVTRGATATLRGRTVSSGCSVDARTLASVGVLSRGRTKSLHHRGMAIERSGRCADGWKDWFSASAGQTFAANAGATSAAESTCARHSARESKRRGSRSQKKKRIRETLNYRSSDRMARMKTDNERGGKEYKSSPRCGRNNMSAPRAAAEPKQRKRLHSAASLAAGVATGAFRWPEHGGPQPGTD